MLDLDHLDRMTLGDSALAAEVLRLFSIQARAFFARMITDAAGAAAAAHQLKGSARAIGAFAVAQAASAFEDAADAARQAEAVAALERALAATERAITTYGFPDTAKRTSAGF